MEGTLEDLSRQGFLRLVRLMLGEQSQGKLIGERKSDVGTGRKSK